MEKMCVMFVLYICFGPQSWDPAPRSETYIEYTLPFIGPPYTSLAYSTSTSGNLNAKIKKINKLKTYLFINFCI